MKVLLSRVLWCLLVANTAMAASEVIAPTAEVMAELRRIEAAVHRGEVDAVRLKYQAAVRARPGDAMPRVFLAWCTLPSDDAWNQLKAVAAIFPDNPWVHYGMGRIYSTWKGMRAQAQNEFELVLKKDNSFFPALTGLGDLYRFNKDYPAAEKYYRLALAKSELPFAYAGLGLTLLAQQKTDEARTALRKAIALQPEQPEALTALIELSREAKEPDTLKLVQMLADLRPKDGEVRRQLADLRFDAGEKAVAAKEYERVVRLGNPSLEVLKRLASLHRELGDTESEERALQNLAALDSKNPEPNIRLAQLRHERKDDEAAEGQWLEAMARDAQRVEPHLAIAQLRLERGLSHESLEEFRKVVQLDPSRTEAVAMVKKLEADFKLPLKKPRGNFNNVFFAVQASLAKFFEERKLANPKLGGELKLRVRVSPKSIVQGVDVILDTVKDELLLGHAYFGLADAQYVSQKGEPTFEFELGAKKAK